MLQNWLVIKYEHGESFVQIAMIGGCKILRLKVLNDS